MAAPFDWRALSGGAKLVLGTIFAILGLVVFLILSGLGISLALREWGSFDALQTVFLAWPAHVLHPSHAPKEGQWLTVTALVPAGLFLALALRATAILGRRSLHGDAKFATEGDLRTNKLRGGSGIMVGWTGSIPSAYGGIKKDGQPFMATAGHLNSKNLLIFAGSEHLLLTAPTRSGKGVGVVQPALLTWEGSAVTLDMKGENHRKTAGYRHECGQRVIVFDPVEPEGKTHRWNPLAYVRRGTLFQVDDLQRIAAFLYPPNDKNPFFRPVGAGRVRRRGGADCGIGHRAVHGRRHLSVANRNHRRVGSQLSDGGARDHCNGFEGSDPQSLHMGA